MPRVMVNDLDYLAACLHGRRSRLADAQRLDALGRLTDLSALGHAIYPQTDFPATTDFQRRLTQDLVREMSGFLTHLDGAGGELLDWMRVRFQVEDIKVLLRRFVHRPPLEAPEEPILSLPPDLALDVPALMAAKSLEEFAERLPSGAPRSSLGKALPFYRDQPRPFFFEAALDQGYFEELLARTERLADEDKELIQPIMLQEADAFQLMLVVRGKFHYGVSPALLSPLHIRWTRIPSERFNAMLAAPDMLAAARLAVGWAIEALPSELESSEGSAPISPGTLEALAWKRFLRLSNRAFRRSHLGLGTVVGYVGMRRVELANLITTSEGIRTRTAAETIRQRLIPRTDLEVARV